MHGRLPTHRRHANPHLATAVTGTDACGVVRDALSAAGREEPRIGRATTARYSTATSKSSVATPFGRPVRSNLHTVDWDRAMEEIKGIARVNIDPGKLEEWKRLTEQAMDIVRTRDPGTPQYEVFFNDDESEASVFERYRDADAALEHYANISHLMEPLMATATVTGEALGTPNDTMRAQHGDQPKLFTPWMAASG